ADWSLMRWTGWGSCWKEVKVGKEKQFGKRGTGRCSGYGSGGRGCGCRSVKSGVFGCR
ncbi:hypothetical protein NDU88_001360, partial [Pleurodeles waltl]